MLSADCVPLAADLPRPSALGLRTNYVAGKLEGRVVGGRSLTFNSEDLTGWTSKGDAHNRITKGKLWNFELHANTESKKVASHEYRQAHGEWNTDDIRVVGMEVTGCLNGVTL